VTKTPKRAVSINVQFREYSVIDDLASAMCFSILRLSGFLVVLFCVVIA
jgi:hypothetical protein